MYNLIYTSFYNADAPYNTWPSAHIVFSMITAFALSNWVKHKFLLTLIWFYVAFLGLSILTTKQHFVWDLMSGAFLSFILCRFWLVQAFPIKKGEQKPT